MDFVRHAKRACIHLQRCDESGNPTVHQPALIIPIYPSPGAGNTCGVRRTVQHFGSSQSSCSGMEQVGNIVRWSSSSWSVLEVMGRN